MTDHEQLAIDAGLFIRRVMASVVTLSLLIGIGLSGALFAPGWWREIALVLCFIWTQRGRCPGMWLVGTDFDKPPNLLYSVLYTVGLASVIFYVFFPFDLMLVNGLCFQLPCYILTGNTFHAWAAGVKSGKL